MEAECAIFEISRMARLSAFEDQAITAGWPIKACSWQKANAMRAWTEEIMAIHRSSRAARLLC